MKLIELLQIYIKSPRTVLYDIRDRLNKRRENNFKKSCQENSDYEDKLIYKKSISSLAGSGFTRVHNCAVYNPVYIVMREINNLYSRQSQMWMKVMSVNVNTQKADSIEVEISLHRPGILIGKFGGDIDKLSLRLSEIFGQKTNIHIVEIKTEDINAVH